MLLRWLDRLDCLLKSLDLIEPVLAGPCLLIFLLALLCAPLPDPLPLA
jgi:hypothetical protein